VFPVRYELPTGGGCSVGVVRSWTKATELVMNKKVDRLNGLVVRVPGHRMEMYCADSGIGVYF
jgi:hypothetical protein